MFSKTRMLTASEISREAAAGRAHELGVSAQVISTARALTAQGYGDTEVIELTLSTNSLRAIAARLDRERR